MAMFGNLSTMGQVSGGFSLDPETMKQLLADIPEVLDAQLKESQAEVDKAYEEKLALFDELDSARKNYPSGYQNSFNSLSAGAEKDYLWHLYDTKELTEAEYKEQVHDAYRQEFAKNSQQGIYTGYVPYEVEGKTLFVEARHFDPSVNEAFKGQDDFIRNSILPHDTFYFPEKHEKQPNLTEKDWLVGMADNSGNIQYVDGFKYNPNKQGGYDSTVEGRAENILDPDTGFIGTISPLINIAGAITGNPLLSAAGTLAAGGDIEDVVKSVAIGQVTAPILEKTVANLGVDADLFGMEPEKFSESMMDVQTTVLKGGDIEKALVKELGVPAVKKVAGAFGDALPDVDFETPQILKDLEDVVKLGVDPIVDVAQKGIDVVQTVTQPISDVTSDIEDVAKEAGREFDETVLQPVKEGVQAVTEPVVDVVDEIIDAVDSPIGNVLEAGGDFIKGMLGGQQPQTVSRTPVENIFDKELFKFDTEIKSTQEMLSPMMNLRRYG